MIPYDKLTENTNINYKDDYEINSDKYYSDNYRFYEDYSSYHGNSNSSGLISSILDVTIFNNFKYKTTQLQNSVECASLTLKVFTKYFIESSISHISNNKTVQTILSSVVDIVFDGIQHQIDSTIRNLEFKFKNEVSKKIYKAKDNLQYTAIKFAVEKIFGIELNNLYENKGFKLIYGGNVIDGNDYIDITGSTNREDEYF